MATVDFADEKGGGGGGGGGELADVLELIREDPDVQGSGEGNSTSLLRLGEKKGGGGGGGGGGGCIDSAVPDGRDPKG